MHIICRFKFNYNLTYLFCPSSPLYIKINSVVRVILIGWTHGAPYHGYGYVPLRFRGGGGGGGVGGEGNVVRRMGTQQQQIHSVSDARRRRSIETSIATVPRSNLTAGQLGDLSTLVRDRKSTVLPGSSYH